MMITSAEHGDQNAQNLITYILCCMKQLFKHLGSFPHIGF